jgi:hypothetical protein
MLNVNQKASVLDALPQTPEILRTRIEGLSAEKLRERVAPDEWTVQEIIAHLRDANELITWRLDKMLVEENPTFAFASVNERVAQRNYNALDVEQVLDEFTRERAAIVARLENLTPYEWARRATHLTYGERDVAGQLRIFVDHDAEHLNQLNGIIEQLIAV